jgi:hypothetical protein
MSDGGAAAEALLPSSQDDAASRAAELESTQKKIGLEH